MPKMTIKNFDHLPLDEKTNYLWDKGVCLSQRVIDAGDIICIFHVDDFYVEATYSRNNNRVDRIVPIPEIKKFEVYVDTLILQLLHQS